MDPTSKYSEILDCCKKLKTYLDTYEKRSGDTYAQKEILKKISTLSANIDIRLNRIKLEGAPLRQLSESIKVIGKNKSDLEKVRNLLGSIETFTIEIREGRSVESELEELYKEVKEIREFWEKKSLQDLYSRSTSKSLIELATSLDKYKVYNFGEKNNSKLEEIRRALKGVGTILGVIKYDEIGIKNLTFIPNYCRELEKSLDYKIKSKMCAKELDELTQLIKEDKHLVTEDRSSRKFPYIDPKFKKIRNIQFEDEKFDTLLHDKIEDIFIHLEYLGRYQTEEEREEAPFNAMLIGSKGGISCDKVFEKGKDGVMRKINNFKRTFLRLEE